MTENLAGRGEGLAGLVGKWREEAKEIKRIYAHPQDYSDMRQDGRGEAIGECADELETALEAAAPAGTAPDDTYSKLRLKRILSEIQHCDGISRDDAKWLVAALATHPPQAPLSECKNPDCPVDCPASHTLNFDPDRLPSVTVTSGASKHIYMAGETCWCGEKNVGPIREHAPGSPRKVGEEGPDTLFDGAVKIVRPTDLRDRVGRFLCVTHGYHTKSKPVSIGTVQDLICEFVASSAPVGEQK